jgi:two-component system OmpR family response regulator
MSMNVLVLEDDRELSAFILNSLQQLGHSVHGFENGQDALSALVNESFDVAVLDRIVPGLDGLSVVKLAREAGCQTPMLMISGLAGIEDRVAGLEGGADDYLVKPFAFAELAARIMALGRRPPNTVMHDRLVFNDIEMNLNRHTVTRGGGPVELQPREFSMLEQLMRSPDRVVTRGILLDRVWSFGFDPQTNIVETHMSRLRTKLNHGFDHDTIRTVRGSGYILRGPDG